MNDYDNNRSPNRITPTNHTPGVGASLKTYLRLHAKEIKKIKGERK